jgi:hypothetical protein
LSRPYRSQGGRHLSHSAVVGNTNIAPLFSRGLP